jgi:hypothetical protein
MHIQAVNLQYLRHALAGRPPQLRIDDAAAGSGKIEICTRALPFQTLVLRFDYLTRNVLEPACISMCQYVSV